MFKRSDFMIFLQVVDVFESWQRMDGCVMVWMHKENYRLPAGFSLELLFWYDYSMHCGRQAPTRVNLQHVTRVYQH